MKYIDAEKLIAEIERRMTDNCELGKKAECFSHRAVEDNDILALVDSLQQDKDVLDLCSQVWWEDRGWIMIPPNVTLKGIESLLEKVRHKIKWNEENGIEDQEQPEELHFTPLNRLIQKIPSKNWNKTVNNYAKKLRDCLIKEGYLKDAKVLQGYISYMNGNNVPMATMDNQEQPEVNLEKEIENHIKECLDVKFPTTDIELIKKDVAYTAKKFYELGLNARKEE